MSVQRFQVTTNRSNRKRTVKVAVYDDLKHMQRDAQAWTKRSRGVTEYFTDALGVAHKFEHIRVNEDGSDGESLPKCGYIRLHKGHLKTGIITHEVAHLAVWIHHLDADGSLEPDNIEREEMFCHVLGDLSAQIVSKLYKIGAIK